MVETRIKQTTNTLFMVEPVSFGFNPQTAVNNYFQYKDNSLPSDVQSNALLEFMLMVKILRANGLNIITIQDTHEPNTPDAIFPNNWISFHSDGRVVLYPMYAENRRAERRKDILQYLTDQNYNISEIKDYTRFEENNRYLEGTGSIVFDHIFKVAYAAISERTDKALFLQFCSDFDYKPVYFSANQTAKGKRLPIYHTNVMMCICNQYAVVCLTAIDNPDERNTVIDSIAKSNMEMIEISEEQMHCFAGNMLQVENNEGKYSLVMSTTAFKSFNKHQIEKLNSYNRIIAIDIPTIEKMGGGGVRCMMAEIFNQKNKVG